MEGRGPRVALRSILPELGKLGGLQGEGQDGWGLDKGWGVCIMWVQAVEPSLQVFVFYLIRLVDLMGPASN